MSLRKRSQFMAVVLFSFFTFLFAEDVQIDKLYTGSNVKGEKVIGVWDFDINGKIEDISGNKHTPKFRGGASGVADGRFGKGFRTVSGIADSKSAGGIIIPDHESLTPKSSFTLELSFKPDDEFQKTKLAFLLDKKFIQYPSNSPKANYDYQIYLRQINQNTWTVNVSLGFLKDSVTYTSRSVDLKPANWHHLAFTYDGKGTGQIYLDGVCIGESTFNNKGAVADGPHPLIIGNRVGADYYPFCGVIDQVRILAKQATVKSGKLLLGISRPRVFVRMAKKAELTVTILNDSGENLKKIILEVILNDKVIKELEIKSLDNNAEVAVKVPVATALYPGEYIYQFNVKKSDSKIIFGNKEVKINIVSRRPALRMPVVMWGHADLKKVQEAGFTHSFVNLVDGRRVAKAKKTTMADSPANYSINSSKLDQALLDGFGVIGYICPGRFMNANFKSLQRIQRNGKKYKKHNNICGLFPAAQQFAYDMGASAANTYGKFPAFEAAIVESEVRDGNNFCFHKHDKEAFKKFAGYDIPKSAASKRGLNYRQLKGFPSSRVISDTDPILTYFKWFWQEGDGWNKIFTQTNLGLKSTGRDDLWTFFDPAIRVPYVSGSGGGVDYISQWTYTYPDPLKIGKAADELFAMANLSKNESQEVMNMTQVIWYRSQTAPKRTDNKYKNIPLADWEKKHPNADLITIAPDNLREAFWCNISRPIKGMMFHGWWSLMNENQKNRYGYRYTNSESQDVLKELIDDVVKPLGPTLLQIPDPKSDVAFLQSFASDVYAGIGEFGWGFGWLTSSYEILRYADIQPQVIYDETIIKDGLAQFKILVLMDCPVLTKRVYAKIKKFQRKGGLIVGDETLVPGIIPDILISKYKRSGKPDKDKEALQKKARQLREELAGSYKWYAYSQNPDVLVRFRKYKNTDYLFAINDKRTFGDYVGQFGLVMEKGLPTSGELSIARKRCYVYDLVIHEQIMPTKKADAIKIEASFEPGAGHLFMITPTPIKAVKIQNRDVVKTGQAVKIKIQIVDDKNTPVVAVVPIDVSILDSNQMKTDYSGFYGALDGELEISLDIAPNAPVGVWQIKVKELASGKTKSSKMQINH